MMRETNRPAARRCLAAGLALLAAGPARAQENNAGGSGAAPAGPPPQPVRVLAVERERIADRRMVTGELRAIQRSRVAAREPGVVLEVPVREGQRVAKGDLLAVLDDVRLRLELDQIDADRALVDATLLERRADVTLRRWRHRALEELARRGSSYEQELREAESAVAIAEARVTQSERQLELSAARRALVQRRIDDMRIVAPFPSFVVARHVDQGGFVAAGGAVVEVVSAGTIEAWFAVPENLAAAVRRPAATIDVRLATGRTLRSAAFRVVPDVAAGARVFPLVVVLEDPQDALQPGLSAQAFVPTGDEVEHLMVAADAVLRNEAGAYVYVARGRGGGPPRAMPTPVEVLFASGSRYAVRAGGLSPGDLVVVEGNERLFPGAPVATTPAAKN